MATKLLAMMLVGCALLAACAEPPAPRSVDEFLEDPIILEAAVVRCAQQREETRYDAECINARQAVSILEASEERERAEILEAQSERKRQALRRTQEAAAQARRQATEAERQQREAEYLNQFGELPPPEGIDSPADSLPASDGGNAPVAEAADPAD